MTSGDAFSPFESLLLVQTLAAHGTKAETFERISISLNEASTPRLTGDGVAEKFSEESLKDRYLRLLKIEAKQHLSESLERDQELANGTTDGELAEKPTLSPKTPTMEDASRYSYLLPQLVLKLYDAYKEQVIREIRAEEQRYDELLKEIDQVKLQPTDASEGTETSLRESDGVALAETTSKPTIPQEKRASDAQEQPPSESSTGTIGKVPQSEVMSLQLAGDKPTEEEPESKANANIRSILNTPIPEKQAPTSPKRAQQGIQSVSKKDAVSQSPVAPTQRRIPPPLAPAVTSHLPTLQPNLPGYRLPGEAVHHSPYEPLTQLPTIAPSPAPQYGPQHANTLVPPPSGLPVQQTPGALWNPAQPNPEQVQQATSQPQGRNQSLAHADREDATSQPHSLPQQQYATPGHAQQTPIQSNSAARAGGIMLPPFQVSASTTGTPASVQAQLSRSTTGVAVQRIQPKPPASTPAGLTRVPQQPGDLRTPSSAAQQTPIIRTGPLLQSRPGITFSPGSSTGWKIAPSAPSLEVERPSWTPGFDDAFTADPIATPMPASTPKGKRSSKSARADKVTDDSVLSTQQTPTTVIPRRSKAGRATSKTPSLAATSTRTRTRSHSVVSQGEESVKRVVANRKIKNEQSTPVTEPGPEGKVPARRGRRPTNVSSTATSIKRKRASSDANTTDPLDAPTPIAPPQLPLERTATIELPSTNPTTIMAFRNFQKMTAPIMNNITSHKHASIFANPVKDRDAEGYSDIIRRPQDLKSIRGAIVAGSRTVAALTAGDGPATPGTPRGGANTPSGPGGSAGGAMSSTTVTLPWSQDLLPPRAIVNGAQLEQEVMRMFANAVMFNAGDDGVVRDTREMFESVEASIHAWRAAERNAAEQRGATALGGAGSGGPLGTKVEGDVDEPDELGDVDDSMVQPSAKRRKAM